MKNTALLIGLFSSFVAHAQFPNLVPNPSFEDIKETPRFYSKVAADFDENVADWETTNKTSPDLITAQLADITRAYEMPEARTGKSMVGLINNMGWWTEYVSVALSEPVLAHQEYYAEFWVMVLENKNITEGMAASKINPQLGLWFHQGFKFETKNAIQEKPQIAPKSVKEMPFNTWIKVSGTFIPEEDLSHISIGQFAAPVSQQVSGCLLIDDVVVRATGNIKMEVGETIVLDDVNFKTGTAILEHKAFTALALLEKNMLANPALAIAIEGHTDTVGEDAANLKLSTQRAEAVFKHLVRQGISTKRLSYQGFGESQPIASNDNATGRRKNRRVAFKVIEHSED